MTPVFKIHPAIGVARVGSSNDYYVAPQTAGGLPENPDGRPFDPEHDFRSGDGKLRRQAARFQIYRYDTPDSPGVPVELGKDGVSHIAWTVHVANKKAIWYEFRTWEGEQGYAPTHPLRNPEVRGEDRRALIVDPGPRAIDAPEKWQEFDKASAPAGYSARFPPPNLRPGPVTINTLGGAKMDDRGRLVVAGGHGRSGSTAAAPSIKNYANNDGWFDDTSDGPVTARITWRGQDHDVLSAWVITAPPAYAPEILNIVTLHDTIYDMLVRWRNHAPAIFEDGLWKDDYHPSFEDEIRPILERPLRYNWVVNIPNRPHDFDMSLLGDPDPRYNSIRRYYLGILRGPDDANQFTNADGIPLMPYLAGDGALRPPQDISRYLVLTQTQYFLLSQWARGRFTRDRLAERRAGDALDRATLENCVGGAFSPGIEMTWISRQRSIFYAGEPFRIKVKKLSPNAGLSLGERFEDGLEPGDISKYMAVPWQADFNECSVQPITEYGKQGSRTSYVWWWPAQRPLMVFPKEAPTTRRAWTGQLSNPDGTAYLNFANDLEMVEKWDKLGFVVNLGGERPRVVEVARQLPYDEPLPRKDQGT